MSEISQQTEELSLEDRRAAVADLRDLVMRGHDGDEEAIAKMDTLLKEIPTVARKFGNLNIMVEEGVIERTLSGNPFRQKALRLTLEQLREKLPESPAARWDARWSSRLAREALERLAEHYSGLTGDERARLNLEVQDEYHDRMNLAGEENDPAAYRRALAGWERAGREAFEDARSGKSVAS